MPLGFNELQALVTPFSLARYQPRGTAGELFRTLQQGELGRGELAERARATSLADQQARAAEAGVRERAQLNDKLQRDLMGERRGAAEAELAEKQRLERDKLIREAAESTILQDPSRRRVLLELLRRRGDIGGVEFDEFGDAEAPTGGSGGALPQSAAPADMSGEELDALEKSGAAFPEGGTRDSDFAGSIPEAKGGAELSTDDISQLTPEQRAEFGLQDEVFIENATPEQVQQFLAKHGPFPPPQTLTDGSTELAAPTAAAFREPPPAVAEPVRKKRPLRVLGKGGEVLFEGDQEAIRAEQERALTETFSKLPDPEAAQASLDYARGRIGSKPLGEVEAEATDLYQFLVGQKGKDRRAGAGGAGGGEGIGFGAGKGRALNEFHKSRRNALGEAERKFGLKSLAQHEAQLDALDRALSANNGTGDNFAITKAARVLGGETGPLSNQDLSRLYSSSGWWSQFRTWLGKAQGGEISPELKKNLRAAAVGARRALAERRRQASESARLTVENDPILDEAGIPQESKKRLADHTGNMVSQKGFGGEDTEGAPRTDEENKRDLGY